MSSINEWNPKLYDSQFNFVSAFGKGVLELLQPAAGERILDLGCGTGDLTEQLAASGALPVGVDLSPEMIEQARGKYPHIPFEVANAEQLRVNKPFDAVFSNAALHWMKDAESVAASVWRSLKPGGRFVVEFGGRGNCGEIIRALESVLAEQYGIDTAARNPWYFPSLGEYIALLERHGFHVFYAHHFDRPTLLSDGDKGIRHWLNIFGDDFFQGLSETDRETALQQIENRLRSTLYRDGAWYGDYKRLRIAAVKNG